MICPKAQIKGTHIKPGVQNTGEYMISLYYGFILTVYLQLVNCKIDHKNELFNFCIKNYILTKVSQILVFYDKTKGSIMKVKIVTLGCKVNQFESQAMFRDLMDNGFEIVGENEKADISIINSCAVTQVSEQKAVKLIRRTRREAPDTVIVLTGCMAQAFPESGNRLDEVDIILGNKRRKDLVPTLKKYFADRQKLTFVED